MGNAVLIAAAVLVGAFLLVQVVARIFRRFVHFPAPAWCAPLLDSSMRRLVQPPAKVVRQSKIAKGMAVLEVGCGGGAIAIPAARAIGPEGRLCALDVQPAMLKRFRRKLALPENRDVMNVDLVQADARELPFEDESFDLVYTVSALPEVPDQQRALAEVMRVLRPGGILAVT